MSNNSEMARNSNKILNGFINCSNLIPIFSVTVTRTIIKYYLIMELITQLLLKFLISLKIINFLIPKFPIKYFGKSTNTPSVIPDGFKKIKEKNTFRIFALGGSTTAGFPHPPNGSFPKTIKNKY